MMIDPLDVKIRIVGEMASFLKDMKSASENTRDFDREIGGVNTNAGRATSGISKLKLAIVGLAGAYVSLNAGVSAFVNVLSTVQQVQGINTRLRGLLSTSQEYAATQSYLTNTSDRLNASQITLSESYTKLLPLVNSNLLSIEDARQILEGFANVAAKTGASSAQLGQTMFGLSQGLSSGTLRAEELNQVTEPLPGILQALDKAAGLAGGGFRKLVNDGQVSSAFFRDTLIKALQDYEGAAEGAAGNIAPSFTRVENALVRLKSKLEAPISALIIPILEQVIKYAGELSDTLVRNQDGITEFGRNLGSSIITVMKAVISLATAFAGIASWLAGFIADNETLVKVLILSYLAINALQSATMLLLQLKIASFVAQFLGLGGILSAVTAGFSLLGTALMTVISALSGSAVAAGVLMSVLGPIVSIVGTVYVAVKAFQLWRESIEIAANSTERLSGGLAEVRQRGLAARDAIANLGQLDNDGLEALRSDLIGRLSTLDGILMEMDATISDGGKVDMQAYQEATSLAKIYRDQLVEVKARLSEVRETKIEVKPEIKPLLDSEKEVEAFFNRVKALGNQRIDLDLTNIQNNLENLSATLGADNTDNARRITEAYRTAANQILALEEARAQTEIQIAERIYLDKANRIKATVTDEQKAATEMRAITDQLMQNRVSAMQSYQQSVQTQLDQAREKWRGYAEEVRGLEKSITDEHTRQSEVMRNIEREGMTDAEQYADRRKELAELEAAARSALAAGNLKEAEELARKMEQVAVSLPDAAKSNGAEEYNAQKDALYGVKSAHDLINTSLTEQKQLAEDNKAAQQGAIDTLSASLENVAGEISALQEKQLDLSLKVTAPELEAELDEVQKRIEQRDLTVALKIDPSGYGGGDVNQYLADLNIDPKNILFNPDMSAVETVIAEIASMPVEKEVRFKANTLDLQAALQSLRNTGSAGDSASGYATGGYVSGPGGPTSDSIWARLSNGEFVQPARAVRHYGAGFMEAVRNMRLPTLPELAMGGMITLPSFSAPRVNYADGGGVIGGMPQVVKLELNLGGRKLPPLHAPSDEVGALVNALRGLA